MSSGFEHGSYLLCQMEILLLRASVVHLCKEICSQPIIAWRELQEGYRWCPSEVRRGRGLSCVSSSGKRRARIHPHSCVHSCSRVRGPSQVGHGHRILCNGRTSPTVGYIRVVSQGRGWSLLWDLSKKWLVEIVSDEL